MNFDECPNFSTINFNLQKTQFYISPLETHLNLNFIVLSLKIPEKGLRTEFEEDGGGDKLIGEFDFCRERIGEIVLPIIYLLSQYIIFG